MKAKHTEGKWTLTQTVCANNHWATFQIMRDDLLIAKVEAMRHFFCDCAEDNARLMAAAPALEDALRQIVFATPRGTVAQAIAQAALETIDQPKVPANDEAVKSKLAEVHHWCRSWLERWAKNHKVDYEKMPYLHQKFFKAVDKQFGSVNAHTGGGCFVSYLMVDGDHYIGINEECVVAYYRMSGAQLQSHEDAANADSDHWKEFNIISLL